MNPVKIYKISPDTSPENPFTSDYMDRCTRFVAEHGLRWFFEKVQNATVLPGREYDLTIHDYAFYVYEHRMEIAYPILQSFSDSSRYELQCDETACEVFAMGKFSEDDPRHPGDRAQTSYDMGVTDAQREVFEHYVGKWVEENLKYAEFPSRCLEGKTLFIFLGRETADKEGIEWDRAQSYVDAELTELCHWCEGEVYGYTCYEGQLDDELLDDLPKQDQVEGPEGVSCFVINDWDWQYAFDEPVEQLEETDSCWGFYGYGYIKGEVESLAKQELKEVVSEAEHV